MERTVTLDAILLSEPRLLIMSVLKKQKSAEFTELKELLNIAPGNLSLQIKKLKDAGYIEILKSFRDNYPLTVCRLTEKGNVALNLFSAAMNELLA